jgi:ABC-type polysaccharide/polyol phosphate export permease
MGLAATLREQVRSRRMVWSLAKSDFRNKYVGSYFGFLWEVVQPLALIFVFWFVFGFALKQHAPGGGEFLPWLVVGLIPWFLFSDAWTTASNSFIQYSFLVKKMVFRTELLPTVKIVSALFTSIIFHIILVIVLLSDPSGINWMSLGVVYFLFCVIILTLGLSYLTSSIMVFFKDTRQIIGIILLFGMYLTPILWDPSIVGSDIRWIMDLNPMNYVVEGYRSCLLGGSFNLDPLATGIFWAMTLIILYLGVTVYARLRPHFSDVL